MMASSLMTLTLIQGVKMFKWLKRLFEPEREIVAYFTSEKEEEITSCDDPLTTTGSLQFDGFYYKEDLINHRRSKE